MNAQINDSILIQIKSNLESYNSETAYKLINDNINHLKDSTLIIEYRINELNALEQLELYDESILLSNDLLALPNLNDIQKTEIYLLRALVYEILEDLKKSEKSLNRASHIINNKIIKDNPSSVLCGRYFIRCSSYYRQRYLKTRDDSDFNKYLKFAQKALDFSEKYNYHNMKANANMLLSFNPILSLDQSQQYLQNALRWWKKSGDIHGVSGMYNNLAILNMRTPKLAMKYNDSAIRALNNKNLPNVASNVYNTRYEIFKLIGKSDSALSNYIKYKKFSDSLDLNRKLISVKRIDEKALLESKKLNTKILKEAIAKEKRNNNILVIIAIILILFIILFVLIYLKLSKKKKELARSRKEISINLEEKTLLLTELNHRVKNNLAMIIGLIQLQNSKESQININQLENRVHTMAMAHNLFSYSKEHLKGSEIKLRDYISVLESSLNDATDRDIDFIIKIPALEVSLENALPIGMIFNELVTNSIKHAVVNSGSLIVEFEVNQINDLFVLYYKDNGEGFDDTSKESTGIFILNVITKQLNGTLNRINTEYYITLQKK